MGFVYVIQGFDQGVRRDIVGEVFRIGRDSSNHLQLQDSEVSRFHAEIRETVDGMKVLDLQSSNGIFVNGTQCSERILSNGDRIQFGKTHLIFTNRDQPITSDLSAPVRFDESSVQASRIVKTLIPEINPADSNVVVNNLHQQDDVNRHLQVMYRTTMAVSQTLQIDQLLESLMNLIFESVSADRGCIILQDEQTNKMTPMVSKYRNGLNQENELIISQRILDYVVEHEEGVLTTDAGEDDRWEAAGSIVGNQIKEAICVPLSGRYGQLGVIYIDTSSADNGVVLKSQTQHFTDEHLKMMIAIGQQAALAIEDTRYYSSMVNAERLAAMGQTITAISHHIKNIIQGVNGGSYLVEEGIKAKDLKTLERGWSIVQRNQHRISELVMDMLSYSKERRPEVSSSNLNNVVEDVVDILRQRADTEGTKLIFEGLSGIHQYIFDPDGIHRALLNIVSNALDAVCDIKDGRVVIMVDHDMTARMLQVRVRDNGPGIAEEQKETVFQAFVSNKSGQGTGLGLAVSRKILREHDGNILIESNNGNGCTFILTWPSVSATQQAERLRDSSIVEQNRLL
tara:strand:- start:4301 stop:6007 length:1707 start_codon:yes stop_codon:yes gene_type:complete